MALGANGHVYVQFRPNMSFGQRLISIARDQLSSSGRRQREPNLSFDLIDEKSSHCAADHP
jgi:hypothetical protein